MGGADHIRCLDMGHNCLKDVLTFRWNNLGFNIEVIDGSIKRNTLRCLAPVVKQVEFPDNHKVWSDLEEFVFNST